ncbi:ankyrin repeat domain-containing protein [Puniceicoccus vermicola]|uniref:Ankyrin repeat domain-containing protein n=1 Tax=Puniceicoccus vermicola TaxID=388746 RepID=A0A7X1AWM1_9BACT|nr:hypothetical protein [Puniceicoccus vermicola]
MKESFVTPLPSHPHWDQQKKQAKQLLRSYWQEEEKATARFRSLHPEAPEPAAARLHDAQLVVARGYGFPSWAKLKRKIESLTQTPVERFVAAVQCRDIAATRQLLESYKEVRARINDPLFSFDSMAIHAVGDNVEFLAMLRDFGADLNLRTKWKCGGFALLDQANPGMLPQLQKLGIRLTVHAAARMNCLEELHSMLRGDPGLARERGGDGQTPLHVAASVEVIDLLVQYGADVEARDIDHSATPAQYLVDKPKLCRHLLKLGVKPDLFMAVVLNDIVLARECILRDPACVAHRIGLPPWCNDEGGHIYIWKLKQTTPLQLARHLGLRDMESYLLAQSPPIVCFLDALWRGDAVSAKRLLAAERSTVIAAANDSRILAEAAFDGRLDAVTLMLELGLDPQAAGVHDSTPLDRASFHGYADIVEVILKYDSGESLKRTNEFGGVPLMTCIHGALHGWDADRPKDYVRTATLLLSAGASFEPSWLPTGDDALDKLFRSKWLESIR